MTEKQPSTKQTRHESAKTKYHHYQRVLSCKNLMKNTVSMTPSPGQFIVESNAANNNNNNNNSKNVQLPKLHQSKSYSILLTKNIKSIIQKSNPVPFGEVLSEVVMKKSVRISDKYSTAGKDGIQQRNSLNKNQNQQYFKRPISAKIYHETEGREIEQSQILRHAFEEDKKLRKMQQSFSKNYFQVKPKLKIPKHIHGYNTVILDNESNETRKTKTEQQQQLQNKYLPQIPSRLQKTFLPTQYYLSESLTPEQLLKKYKNQNDIIFGFSKWFHTDGTSSWKRCRILGYVQEQQRWEIQWLGTGVNKKVSRNNLYFQREDFKEFQAMIANAEQLKKRSEIYMKYNILINLLQTPTPELSSQTQQKIQSLLTPSLSPSYKSLKLSKNDIIFLQTYKANLYEDIKKQYLRACHQFQFNMVLPYNTQYQKIFQGVLPKEMFHVNPRKALMAAESQKQIKGISRKECSQIFANGLKKIKQRCFLNSEKKIKILQLVNIISEQLSAIDLLKDYKKLQQKAYTLTELDVIINRNISEYFYKINCRICDIEHLVSKELDPLYANKKLIPEETYNSTMTRYHKFLLLVNMKLEQILRQSTQNLIRKLALSFPQLSSSENSIQQSTRVNYQLIFSANLSPLKLTLTPVIKQQNLEISPDPQNLSSTLNKNIDRILQQLSTVKCISKSYLPQIRPSNILQIIKSNYQCQQINKLNQTIENLKNKIKFITGSTKEYIAMLGKCIQEIFKLYTEAQKKFQKKGSYGEIQEIIQKINCNQRQINMMIKVKHFNICGLFQVNFEEVKQKISVKISQTMREMVNMLIDKIYKDNDKIQKNVVSILQTMQKTPKSIEEYVQLQTFVTETVRQQIQKIHSKARMLTEKMNLLQKTSQIIEYREFQICCQIYLKPLRLKKARQESMYKLENIYKKNFAEQLMKDGFMVLDNIKNCERKFNDSLNFKSLEDMDSNFKVFSDLNSQIDSSCQKMSTINEKQGLLKWTKTNFDRLLQVKQQFEPYYKLITLHKNYRLNIIPLMDQAFSQINYNQLYNNVASSFETLKFLHTSKFNGDPVYEPITENILKQYKQFNQNLPLIKALRNPDLRDRHWAIIQSLTGVTNIRSQQITLNQVLSQSIKSQQEQLFKISQIATKQLIYEKSLNQLKRQWKDVRVVLKEIKIGNQMFKLIKNINEVEKKLQNDILQVNNILSSSFIKFLQADVTHWKSSVLQKIYQFVNYWPNFQSKIVFYLRLLSSPNMSQLFQNSSHQKNLQKSWKQFISNIEYQSVMIDITNTRTWESISNLELLMQEIQRVMSQYLEEKKRMNSKLRLFSDDTLISLMIQSDDQAALENMKKCFTGAKSIKIIQEPGQQNQNIQILSTLDQKITVKLQQKPQSKTQKKISPEQQSQVKKANMYHFDQMLLAIDKQLKKQIKLTFLSSLQHEQHSQNNLLCQVQLLRSRLIFKNRLQKAMETSQSLDGYEIQLSSDQREQIQNLLQADSYMAMQVRSLHVLELCNQLALVQILSHQQNPVTSFQYYKYPKYQLSDSSSSITNSSSISSQNSKLKLLIGHTTRQYQFQLIQCKNYVMNNVGQQGDRFFVEVCTALHDRMMPMINGRQGMGRIVALEYLGELMGRSVTKICCTTMTAPANLLQYLKIGASGLFLILNHFENLSRQSLSVFSQSLSTFWINYQLSRANVNTFKISSQQFVLDVPNFTIFSICNNNCKPLTLLPNLKQNFRTFSFLPQIKFQNLLKYALISFGINCDQIKQNIIQNIQLICQELNYWRIQGKIGSINRNVFGWQVVKEYGKRYVDIKEKLSSTKGNVDDIGKKQSILRESLEKIVELYIPQQKQVNKAIWKSLSDLKLISKSRPLPFTKIQVPSDNSIQQNFLSKSANVIKDKNAKNLQNLKTLLDFHCGVVITGPKMSGKSTLINNLIQLEQQNVKYNFSSINPLAYTMQQLYLGDSQSKGIIRQLVQQLKIKSSALQLNYKVINGLYFDSQIGKWAEPLLPIINQPNLAQIACQDGSLLTLPASMKLIFQAENLAHMQPNNFHSLGLISLSQQIKWQDLLNNLLEKYFGKQFISSPNAKFINQLMASTFDSLLDFYKELYKQRSNSKYSQIQIGRTVILEQFIKFFSSTYFKQDVHIIVQPFESQPTPSSQSQPQQKPNSSPNSSPSPAQQPQAQSQLMSTSEQIKSQIFNIYTYSLISTMGLLIPQQTRKTYSRHLKYVLEQSPLSRYGWKKNNIIVSASKDQENIYDMYYQGAQWKRWKNCQKYISGKIGVSPNGDGLLLMDQYRLLWKVLQSHVQSGTACFIIGEECSSKSYIFKNFISELKSEKYTKNYFTCSTLTKKFNVSNKIAQMIQTQKYSRKINGFSNCKKNLIYIQDLNMTLQSPASPNASILELLKQFHRKKSLFIQLTAYKFHNLQFYGTLNQNLPLPASLLRHVSSILMNTPQSRTQSILQFFIKTSPISSFQKQLIIRCTLNLQDVINRDLSLQTNNSNNNNNKSSVNNLFNMRDMIRVIKGVSKISQNISNSKSSSLTLHSLLRFWVYVSDKVYSQKLALLSQATQNQTQTQNQKKGFLFYLINNVLMEEQRVRYRTVCPSLDYFVIGIREDITDQNNIVGNGKNGNNANKQVFHALTMNQLVQKLKQSVANCEKYKNLSMMFNENCHEIVKLIVKFSNSFEFESKTIIVFNQQRKRLSTILKLVSFISKSMYHQHLHCNLSTPIAPQNQLSTQKSINTQFTKNYIKIFKSQQKSDKFETISKFSTPFQSQFQSKQKIQNQFNQQNQNNNVDFVKEKNRVVLHLSDREYMGEGDDDKQLGHNFILEDLLSFRKLNKYPKWLVPQQELYQDLPLSSGTSHPLGVSLGYGHTTQSSIVTNKKIYTISKNLSNRDSQQIQKQAIQRETLCKKIDMNIVLQFYNTKNSEYVLKYYKNLVGQSSIIHIKNIGNLYQQAATVQKANKVIMTDVKVQQQVEQQFGEYCYVTAWSSKQITTMANRYGPKVYIDLVYETFQAHAHQNWYYPLPVAPLSYKHSFRQIFLKFLAMKHQKTTLKANIDSHIMKTNTILTNNQSKLEHLKKEGEFVLGQFDLRLKQITSKLAKQDQKYWAEKKKLQDIHQKIAKKQKQYQQSIGMYRQSMDKLAFEYGKAKQKFIKTITMFESGKFNVNNVLSTENKLLIEAFCLITGLVDVKKNQDVSMQALKQFVKCIKQKKLSKILLKTNIEHLISKALSKIQKNIQQSEFLKSQNISTKKLPEPTISNPNSNDLDELQSLKSGLVYYLQISLLSLKQFNSPKVQQYFETFQSAQKSINKLKTQLSKKQKSKANKQLFESYHQLMQQKSELQQKISNKNTNLKQITSIMTTIQHFTNKTLLKIRQIASKQIKCTSKVQSNALIMSICTHFFNILYPLSSLQLCSIFQQLYTAINKSVPDFPLESIESLCNINQKQLSSSDNNIVVNSLFSYRGIVLIQVPEHHRNNSNCNSQIGEKFGNGNQIYSKIFKNKNVKVVASSKILNDEGNHSINLLTGNQMLIYDAVYIEVQRSSSVHKTIRKIQKIINKLSQADNPLIFIECTEFSQEQKNNFPFIDLTIKTGIRKGYDQIYQSIKDGLFSDSTRNKQKRGEDNENQVQNDARMKTTIRNSMKASNENNSSEMQNTEDTISKFLKFNFECSQVLNIQQLKHSCTRFTKLFAHLNGTTLSHEHQQFPQTSQCTSRPIIQPSSSSLHHNETQQTNTNTSALTQKQRQKAYLQHKICQFFTRHYLVLQSVMYNTHKYADKYGVQLYGVRIIGVQSYIREIIKLMRNNYSMNLTTFENNQYLYLKRIQTELKVSTNSIHFTLLLMICNCKISIFGDTTALQRYIDLLVCQILRHKYSHILQSSSSSSPSSSSSSQSVSSSSSQNPIFNTINNLLLQSFNKQNQIMPQQQQIRKQNVQKSAKILKYYINNLNSLCQQVILDYDLWVDDVLNIYKEDKQPNVQWMYLMLVYNGGHFWEYINKMENKLIQKYANNGQFYQMQQPIQKLTHLFTPSKHSSSTSSYPSWLTSLTQSSQSPHSITPIFLTCRQNNKQIVSCISEHKLQYQFIDIQYLLEVQRKRNYQRNKSKNNINSNSNTSNKDIINQHRKTMKSINNINSNINNNQYGNTINNELKQLIQSNKLLIAYLNNNNNNNSNSSNVDSYTSINAFTQLINSYAQYKKSKAIQSVNNNSNNNQQQLDVKLIIICDQPVRNNMKNSNNNKNHGNNMLPDGFVENCVVVGDTSNIWDNQIQHDNSSMERRKNIYGNLLADAQYCYNTMLKFYSHTPDHPAPSSTSASTSSLSTPNTHTHIAGHAHSNVHSHTHTHTNTHTNTNTNTNINKAKQKQYKQLPNKLKRIIYQILMAVCQTLTQIGYSHNNNNRGIQIMRRAMLLVDKLCKSSKNFNIQSTTSNTKDKDQSIRQKQKDINNPQSSIFTTWRCILQQILIQNCSNNVETIKSILKKVQCQSLQICQQLNYQNKANTVIRESHAIGKIMRIITKSYIRVKCDSYANVHKYGYNNNKRNIVGDSVAVTYAKLYKQISPLFMELSQSTLQSIKLSQLLYLQRRKLSNQTQTSVSQCKLTLILQHPSDYLQQQQQQQQHPNANSNTKTSILISPLYLRHEPQFTSDLNLTQMSSTPCILSIQSSPSSSLMEQECSPGIVIDYSNNMGIINVNVGNSVSKVKYLYLYGTYADHLFFADYYNNYEDNN